jgi:phosphinothricin acetyltransferase
MNPENHNPSAEFEYRPAQINDVPAILKIVNYYIEHSSSIYEETPRILEDQLQWFLQLQKQNFPIIVALSDTQVVGYACFQTLDRKSVV